MSEDPMSARLNRRGATLPLSILVIGLLGVARRHHLCPAFGGAADHRRRQGGDRRVHGGPVGSVALVCRVDPGRPAGEPPDTAPIRPYLTGPLASTGSRSGILRRPRRCCRPIYVVTSRGTNTAAKRYGARIPPAAQRTWRTYAIWTPAPFDLNAALTSLGAIDKNGGSGEMSGIDNCGVMPNIPGVAVPGVGGVPQYTGPTGPIDGNPDNTPVQLGTAGDRRERPRTRSASTGPASPRARSARSCRTTTSTRPGPRRRRCSTGRSSGSMATSPCPSDGKGILVVTGNLTPQRQPELGRAHLGGRTIDVER